MPLERKLLSKRHLRRKQAENLYRMKSVTTNDIEGNSCIHNFDHQEDILKLHNAVEIQACTATNSIGNIDNPFMFLSENEPSSFVEVTLSDTNNYIYKSVDNPEAPLNPDYIRSQFHFTNSVDHADVARELDVRSNHDHDDNKEFEDEFRNNLRQWACDYNIAHTAIDKLLNIISHRYPFLPKSAKTLLNTDRNVDISRLTNGEMCYIGIRRELESRLRGGLNDPAICTNTLTIDVNIDGLPLFKSSSVNLWPILCRSHSLKGSSPFMVAVFCGKGKPDPLFSYLSDFIEEMNLLLQLGIKYGNKTLRVEIGCFLCDAPARAMLKMIEGHTSTYGCERCAIAAVSEQKKLYYPIDETYNRKRCDDDFLLTEFDTTHIKGISPLLRLPIKLVTQFPLDPMHLIYLGVVKRLITKIWIEGKRPNKLSKEMLRSISSETERLRSYVTAEFIRKPRSIDKIKRWKATEFRFFLVYSGPIILRDVLDSEKYRNFLLLHSAVYILSCESLILRYLGDARRALEKFVQQSARLYGHHFVVYNVHSLLHLCDDVERYGKLQDFSCFPFENYLGKLKKRVRAKRLPLRQVVKRISELSKLEKTVFLNSGPEMDLPKVIKAKGENAFECKRLQTKRFKLSTENPDNIVSVNGKIYIIKSLICVNGTYKCVGTAFRYVRNLYREPIESSKLGIFFVQSYAATTTFLVEEILFKCLRFPFRDGFGIFPIVHQKDS